MQSCLVVHVGIVVCQMYPCMSMPIINGTAYEWRAGGIWLVLGPWYPVPGPLFRNTEFTSELWADGVDVSMDYIVWWQRSHFTTIKLRDHGKINMHFCHYLSKHDQGQAVCSDFGTGSWPNSIRCCWKRLPKVSSPRSRSTDCILKLQPSRTITSDWRGK